MKKNEFKDLLPLVSKPSRYLGSEINSIHKDLEKVDVKIALAFPDVYEVGMSHQGLQILYHLLNSDSRIAAERVYAPWTDMEELMRRKGFPLSSLESGAPLGDFDILGFSLQYELSYTNMLNMMELSGIPVWSSERDGSHPLVIAGGPCAFNPEAVADFLDAVLIGDGEEALPEMVDIYREWKREGGSDGRKGLLRRLSAIKGVYVPSFFEPSYNEDGTVREIRPVYEEYKRVEKRIIADLNTVPYPDRPVVPFMKIVHDRVNLEVTRGCTRGCRFCQAGMIYRPTRERTPEKLREIAEKALRSTGYEDLSLLSLSTGDYSGINELLKGLMDSYSSEMVAISLPSMRVDTMSPELISEIKRVRKTGFTMAPEAGSERLREVINKGISEKDLLDSIRDVFEAGWDSVKLYFMIGLPTETDEDIMAIVDLCGKAMKACRGRRGNSITASVSTFVPKPHTPFQWEAQISSEETRRRHDILRRELKRRGVTFKWHEPAMSDMEGVFSRGDRRLSKVIVRARELGCRYDGWSDEFRPELWRQAFEESGIDPGSYLRRRGYEEVLPWDHIDSGVTKRFLVEEAERSHNLTFTPDCRYDKCTGCGVCDFKEIKNRLGGDKGAPQSSSRAARPQTPANRVRITFSKTDDSRFLGHLELTYMFARAVRRAGVPVRYSAGFHPKPRITFSPPIPVGMESLCEMADIELDRDMPVGEIRERLGREFPSGMKVEGVAVVPLNAPALTSVTVRGEYDIWGYGDRDVSGDIKRLIDSKEYLVKKEEKEIDVRGLVEGMASSGDRISLTLASAKEGGGIRPGDLVGNLLGLSEEETKLLRVLKKRVAH